MFHRIVAACTAALLVASLTVAVASAAGPMGIWGASISGAGLSGTASLDLPVAGGATAAFSLRHLGAGASVTASVVSGDRGCGGPRES